MAGIVKNRRVSVLKRSRRVFTVLFSWLNGKGELVFLRGMDRDRGDYLIRIAVHGRPRNPVRQSKSNSEEQYAHNGFFQHRSNLPGASTECEIVSMQAAAFNARAMDGVCIPAEFV